MTFFRVGLCLTLLSTGCGTASVDPGFEGRCLPASETGMVASIRDTDAEGAEWRFTLAPTAYRIACTALSTAGAPRGGVIDFYGLIVDGQGIPKPGLSAGASTPIGDNGTFTLCGVSGTRSQFCGQLVSETVTDSCGVIRFVVAYTCPNTESELNYTFVGFSGALRSEDASVSVRYDDESNDDEGNGNNNDNNNTFYLQSRDTWKKLLPQNYLKQRYHN